VSEPGIKVANAQWLRAFLDLFFSGQDVKYRVLCDGWDGDRPNANLPPWLGVEVHCSGWSKRFKVPAAMVDAEDVRAVIGEFVAQTEGALLMRESDIRLLEELVH
jgi:hypothetical protein